MDGIDYREYYVTRSVDDLVVDAERRHAALWPALSQVITAHAIWGDPVVIDGWALYPSRIAQLSLPNIASLWLLADDEVLEARVRAAIDFYRGASDEEAMIRHFVARSRWYNRLIHQQTRDIDMQIIEISTSITVSDLLQQSIHAIQRRTYNGITKRIAKSHHEIADTSQAGGHADCGADRV